MDIKKISIIFVCIVMVFSLCACAGSKVPSYVDEEGVFAYSIVRSGEKTVTEIENSVKYLRSAMKDTFGCNVFTSKDTAFEDYDGNYEIIIGDSNREESSIAKERLVNNRENNGYDFIVAVINDKIVIQATSNSVISSAVEWFINTFCVSKEAWSQLKANYQFIYEHHDANSDVFVMNRVNDVNIGNFTVVLPRKASYLLGSAVDEFVDYQKRYGFVIEINDDIDQPTQNELLIGDCEREESKSVSVEGDNYVIKVINDKLVIKGGNDLASWRGVKRFFEEVKNSKNGFTWSDGYTINGKYDATEEGAYTLNWNDEFEGNTIDRNKWGDYKNNSSSTIAASSLGGNCYWTDLFGESPYNGGNLKNLIYQSDGKLVLGAQKVTDKDFVQSRISTYYTMSFRYGLMEICGKLAPDPAFSGYWLNGGAVNDAEYVKRFGKEQERSGMTEIDILENFSSSTSFSSNVHRWWDEYDVNGNKNATGGHTSLDGDSRYTGNSKNNKKFSYDISKHGDTLPDDFHIYSFYWDDNKMKFAFDGKTYFTYSFGENSSVSVHCLMNYLIMECGMGAATYGAAYKNDLHGNYYEHQIDYVRIYQHNAVNSQLITAWPEKQSNGIAKCYYSDNGVNGAY